MKIYSWLLFFLTFGCSQLVLAGKLESVQKVVKEQCQRDLSAHEALKKIRDLYLTCVPGTKVSVDDCKINCLRENSGVIMGR